MEKAPYEAPVWKESAPIRSNVIRTSLGQVKEESTAGQYGPLY